MKCYYCKNDSNYYVGDKCKTVEFNDKDYIICLNCSNELIYKKDMEKYYCVKIDKRKKKAIEEQLERYKLDLQPFIDRNEIYVDEEEGNYVTKQFAKKYCSLEEAENAITEDFEMVSKL